jgi:hypothetical protein
LIIVSRDDYCIVGATAQGDGAIACCQRYLPRLKQGQRVPECPLRCDFQQQLVQWLVGISVMDWAIEF